jgi:hypothetical protein
VGSRALRDLGVSLNRLDPLKNTDLPVLEMPEHRVEKDWGETIAFRRQLLLDSEVWLGATELVWSAQV